MSKTSVKKHLQQLDAYSLGTEVKDCFEYAGRHEQFLDRLNELVRDVDSFGYGVGFPLSDYFEVLYGERTHR